MKELRDEISRFLMEEKNFEVIWELYDIVPNRLALFRKIVAEFLPELNKVLEEKLKETDWNIETDFGEDNDWPSINLQRKGRLDYFYPALEFEIKSFGFYYGLVRNVDEFPHLAENELVEEESEKFLKSNPGFKTSKGWFCYKYFNEDLSNPDELRRFLPANRGALISEYSDLFIKFVADTEGVVTNLVEATRLKAGKKK